MKAFVAYAPVLIMLWTCTAADQVATADAIEGLSLTEMSQIIESTGYSSLFDSFGTPADDGPVEGKSSTSIPFLHILLYRVYSTKQRWASTSDFIVSLLVNYKVIRSMKTS